ncbi:MAG: hypothetical protein PHE15_06180 [Dehalococcoidales bacterium]|nr:hypothetical protein [Dehalococcoidales bacterium]
MYFCAGACGGVVDMILPSVATVASLVGLKVKAVKVSRKLSESNDDQPVDDAGDEND